MSELTEEQADVVGRAVDSLDNGLAALQLPVGNDIHVEGLSGIMKRVRDDLKQWCIDNGHDFWGDQS